MMKDMVIYEHPLNEIIRACLRLEQLFQQIDHQLRDRSIPGTRNIIATIINLLQILDRPDLKSKLAKELSQHHTNLQRYGDSPDIDAAKLAKLIQQTDEFSRMLIDSSAKIGQKVRDVDLLNSLRLHLATPGGGCSFDLPLYHYWLQQAEDIRYQAIMDWLSDFEQIKTIITLVLELSRKSGKSEEKIAAHGFHQELLDPQSNLRMIRIGVNHQLQTYPEVSLGRHFLSVRFFTPDIHKRPTQYNDNLPFLITYCGS